MSDPLPSPIPLPDVAPTKPDYKSRTFWVNFLMGLLSLIATYTINQVTGTDTFSLKSAAPDPTVTVGSLSLPTILALLKWAAASPGILAFINMILRYQTTTAVTPFWSAKPGEKLTTEEIAKLKLILAEPIPAKSPASVSTPAGLILFAVILFTGSLAMAAPPKAVIVGPTYGIPGELLELDASTSLEATHFRWWVSPVLSGRKQVEPLGDGKRVRIASLPGTYTYTLAVGNPEGVDLTSWIVTIPGDPPLPGPSPAPPCPGPPLPPGPTPPQPLPIPIPVPPAPIPTPTPTPDFPAGQFNVAADVYKQAMAVKSPNRAAECKAMAEGFEGVASAAAAGTFNKFLAIDTANAVSQAMIESNRKALPNGYEAWQEFGAKAGTKATELFVAGRLKTGSDWAVLLRETAMGLRAAGVK